MELNIPGNVPEAVASLRKAHAALQPPTKRAAVAGRPFTHTMTRGSAARVLGRVAVGLGPFDLAGDPGVAGFEPLGAAFGPLLGGQRVLVDQQLVAQVLPRLAVDAERLAPFLHVFLELAADLLARHADRLAGPGGVAPGQGLGLARRGIVGEFLELLA